jgi:cardiolipin synthase
MAWLKETVHHESDTFFDGLIAELATARSSVDFEMYIFDDDELGLRVAKALAAAARRGVAVRVLVDGIGSPEWPGKAGRILDEAGIEARVYHPAAWTRAAISRFVREPRKFLRVLNRRDHRKVCVIDHAAAWVGSMNVSVRSLRAVRGPAAWHECGVRVEGAEVEALTAAFDYAWDRVIDPLSRFTNRTLQARRVHVFRSARLVRVNAPRAIRRRNARDLLARIRSARRRVWIENPYFVPTLGFVNALRTAAESGADVRIVLPRRSDIFFMPWVIPEFLERLVRRDLSVFEYMPTTLHAKIMMIDDWVTVGSSNLNHRSLIHDLEVDVVITSPEARASMEERFREDLAASIEVTARTLRARPLAHKLLGKILMPLRYWM